VLLGAGEVVEREGELGVLDHPEIGLDSRFQADAGFGGAIGHDAFDHLVVDEEIRDAGWVVRGDEKIQVADNLLATAITAADVDANHLRQRAQIVLHALRVARDVAKPEAPGVLLARGNGGGDVVGGLFSEAGHGGDFPFRHHRGEFRDGGDTELFPQCLDLFRSEALQFEELEERLGKLLPQLVEIAQFTGGHQLGDLVGDGLADAGDLPECFRCRGLFEIAREGLQGPRRVRVGANLEGVFPLQFEQLGDRFENLGDLVFGDWGHAKGNFVKLVNLNWERTWHATGGTFNVQRSTFNFQRCVPRGFGF